MENEKINKNSKQLKIMNIRMASEIINRPSCQKKMQINNTYILQS